MVDSNDEPYVPIDIPVENTTTDENGLALISNIITNDGTLTFIANKDVGVNYESNTVNINKYDNVTISLSSSSNITSSNRSVTITGKVDGVSEPVTVNLSNVGTLTTGNQGNFSHTYQGQGAGDVPFEASVYGSSASVTIEDVIQYWKAPNTPWNREYQIYNAKLSDVSNGYKYEKTSDTNYLRFVEDGAYSVEFDIVSYDSTVGSQMALLMIRDYSELPNTGVLVAPVYASKNSHISFVYDGNSSVLSVDGEEAIYSDLNDFIIKSPSAEKSIIINNVKVKRL